MKVSARKDLAGVWAQQGVIGDCICLAQQNLRAMIQLVETRAKNLRLTAKAVGVLNPVAVCMRPIEFAVVQQFPVQSGNPHLSRLPPGLVNTGIKGHITAERGIHSNGTDDNRAGKVLFGCEQSFNREGRGDLCAVQQGKPFLGLQSEWT